MDYQLIKFILAALFLIGSPYIVVEGLYRILKSKDEKQRFIGLSHLWVGLLTHSAAGTKRLDTYPWFISHQNKATPITRPMMRHIKYHAPL